MESGGAGAAVPPFHSQQVGPGAGIRGGLKKAPGPPFSESLKTLLLGSRKSWSSHCRCALPSSLPSMGTRRPGLTGQQPHAAAPTKSADTSNRTMPSPFKLNPRLLSYQNTYG